MQPLLCWSCEVLYNSEQKLWKNTWKQGCYIGNTSESFLRSSPLRRIRRCVSLSLSLSFMPVCLLVPRPLCLSICACV